MSDRVMRLPASHPGQREVLSHLCELGGECRELWISAGRRWRKSTACLRPAGMAALRGKKGFWGAPTSDQVNFAWSESKKAFRDVGTLRESFPHRIDFVGGGRITYDTLDKPHHERGATYDFVIIDEASRLKPEAFYEVLLPILGDSHGWLIAIFTPKGLNWTWQEWAKVTPSRKSWQIPTLGVEIIGDRLIRKPHPLENPHYNFAEAEKLFDNMPREVFQQEFLAQFIEGAGMVFRNVDTCCCMSESDRPPLDGVVLGVDLGKHQDFTVIFGLNIYGQEVYFDRFNAIDWVLQEDRIVSASNTMQAPVILDSTGLGDPVYDALVSKGILVYPYKFTSESKGILIRNLAVDFDKRVPKLVDRDVVKNEHKAYAYDMTSEGRFSYSAPEGMHDDTVIGLSLANWGRKQAYIQPTFALPAVSDKGREERMREYKPRDVEKRRDDSGYAMPGIGTGWEF